MSTPATHPQNLKYPSVMFHIYVDTLAEKQAITRHLKVLAALRGMSVSAMLKALLLDFIANNPIKERPST